MFRFLTGYRPIRGLIKKSFVDQNSRLPYSTSNKFRNSLNESLNAVKQGSGEIVQDLSDLLSAMEKKRYNLRLFGLGAGAGFFALSYNFIRSWTSEQATVITTQMLDDEEFNKKVDSWTLKRTEILVQNLVQSEQVKTDVRDLMGSSITDLSNDPKIQSNLQDLFIRIFNSAEILNTGSTLSSNIVERLVQDPEYEKFREQIIIYAVKEVKRVADNKEVQGAISDLIWNSIKQMVTGKNI